MSIPLYGEEAAVIRKTISLTKTPLTSKWHLSAPKSTEEMQELMTSYDVEETAKTISSGGHKKVALQFPDHLLPISSLIANALQRKQSIAALWRFCARFFED